MSLAVAALLAEGKTIIKNSECIDISFPGFKKTLQNLINF
jgi:3-phosphoshikimate 1-carboxyvinyltransferase